MPGTNSRKHVIPLGAEASFTRATIFEQFGQSISDVVPVANVTDRAQVVADLVADGRGPSSTRPLVVIRADAPGLHRIEYTYDGSVFLPVSGVLSFSSLGGATSFATANGGLLSAGDVAMVGATRYEWSGTAWVTAVTPWTTLAAASGWTAGTGLNAPQVSRDGNTVWFRGSLFGGAANTTATTLPTWARPSRASRVWISKDDDTAALIRVFSGGALQPTGNIHAETITSWSVL